jgi:hypothetical protein
MTPSTRPICLLRFFSAVRLVLPAHIVAFGLTGAAIAGSTAHWDPYTPIEASYSQSADFVGVGKQITLSVGSPTDLDAWIVNGSVAYTQADTLTTHWTITCPPPGQTAGTHTGNSWPWTVPTDLVGTFTVDVSVDDDRSVIDLRDDYPWTASGSFTVCRVSGLTADGSREVSRFEATNPANIIAYKGAGGQDGDISHYINLKATSGNVVVTASIEPSWVQEYLLPAGFVTWTSGTAPSPANQLMRWVSRTAASDPDVKAKVGTVDEKTVCVHVVDAIAPGSDPDATLIRAWTHDGSVAGYPMVGRTLLNPPGTVDPDIGLAARLLANRWSLKVTSAKHTLKQGVNITPLTDVPSAWASVVTYDNYLDVVVSLTPIGDTQPPSPPNDGFYSVAITWIHENYHRDKFFDTYWEPIMRDEFIPWAESDNDNLIYYDCNDSLKKTAYGIVDSRSSQVLSECKDWINTAASDYTESSGFENDAHQYSNGYFAILVAEILLRFSP